MQIPTHGIEEHEESGKYDTIKGNFNKTPVAAPKEMDIYEPFDKEFRIILKEVQ